ncbi:PRKR-interacting protein 1 homolog [Microplitis demolitor]|uniref:PRKR-interacting protein 1 homolog n=1 Tax=Microplitis demolitor TaxID=69319 RepID=UPI00235B69E5|nr:PRKR-interacting protein 1 homolog [Microplitis demolitor]
MSQTNKKDSKKDDKKNDPPIIVKSALDLQRLKLQKLMSNPDKEIQLPERPKIKNVPGVPEFVRNVMGSSAGAGSGEFHVYRHLRRKEYARQKFIQEKSNIELLNLEYQSKLEENKLKAEQATAKKRQKRLKRKLKMKETKSKKMNIEDKNSKSDNRNNNDDNKTSSDDNDDDDDNSKID